MPKIIGPRQRKIIGDMISAREGFYCLACFAEGAGHRTEPQVKLVIDHANNDQRDWSPGNIHWICRSHNKKFARLSVREHVSLMAGYSDMNERVRARDNLSPKKTRIQQEVDTKAGSIEVQLNTIYETDWLNFMHDSITVNGSIFRKEAINAGAANVGCSNTTTTRYCDVHTSSEGVFKEIRDSGGHRIIVYRDIEVEFKPATNGHKANGHNKEAIGRTGMVARANTASGGGKSGD